MGMTMKNDNNDWRKDLRENEEEQKLFWFPMALGIVGAILIVVLGFVVFTSLASRESYAVNLYTTGFSIFFAVGIIELFNRRRVRLQLKAQLIRELGGRDTGITFRALKEVRANGWLF